MNEPIGSAGGGPGKTVLIMACSGAANTGSIADRVARSLRSDGVGSMTCLAGIGAGLPSFVEKARGADRAIVIDGCPTGCGAKLLSGLGIAFEAYVVTDFGVAKGETADTPEVVASVAAAIKAKIAKAGPALRTRRP